MNDFDDILKKMKESLGSMATEAQEKYNDLVTYLDTHDSEEIKANLRKMADQVLQDAKEGVEEMKKEASEINVEEKVKQVREAFQRQ